MDIVKEYEDLPIKTPPATFAHKALEKWVLEQDVFFSTVLEMKPELNETDELLIPAMMLNRFAQRFFIPANEVSSWRTGAQKDGEGA
jgi:hypothetical protein